MRSRGTFCPAALAGAGLVLIAVTAGATDGSSGPNGFDVRDAQIPRNEIRRGGPPRDGIPALDAPTMVRAAEAPWPDESMIVGVVARGREGEAQARAYPLDVLVWHELVNDTIAGQPILVSYCPLCGSAMVFERPTEGEADARFGVSGLLYRSDLLMFDRATGSLWTQIEGRAVTGRRTGERLRLMRSSHERWGTWRARHPDTLVLTPHTGHARDYGRQPYGDYARSRRLLFPAPLDSRRHPKMRTLGLRTRDGTNARAYPIDLFEPGAAPVEERFAGHAVRVAFSPERNAFVVEAPDAVEVVETYWFAWMAFHPRSSVYEQRRSD